MDSSISPPILSQLSTLIEAWTGLYFPPDRWSDLERRIEAAAPAFGCADADTCARLLVSSPLTKHQIELLASHLTVGETYFFREHRSFEVLEEHILPRLLDARRGAEQRLRIWSAACCTGEEPYSIAMLLSRAMPDLPAWHTTILASDISPRFLQKAAEGMYGQWSFRSVPGWIHERYFCKTADGRFAIQSSLKQMVSFAQLNLAADVYPALSTNTNAMDVIFCRNVLIYFTAERARRVIEHLYHALVDGGWLIVSPVETAYVLESPFVPVQFPGVTLFHKDLQHPTPYTVGASAVFAPLSPALPDTAFQPDVSVPLLTDAPAAVSTQAVHDGTAHHERPEPYHEPRLTPYEEARALYAHGRYSEAVAKLLELCTATQAQPNVQGGAREQEMALLARAYANQGQLAEAQAWCENAITVNKLNPGLHYLRAIILLERGQTVEARLSLTRSLYLEQNLVLAHFALGNLARQQKEFKEADKHFENALTLLRGYRPDEILPESEGITAGRLAQIIAAMTTR
ncbi:MAG: chemotaxis protein CheR [Deltaproteobacteria bacterium]|nr:chemotaxis protein CheR [Deltaproteobacteria bacterium]